MTIHRSRWQWATKPNDIPKDYPHYLVLSLIAVGMLDPKMTEVKDDNGKSTEKMIFTPTQNDDGVMWKSPSLWAELINRIVCCVVVITYSISMIRLCLSNHNVNVSCPAIAMFGRS